MMSCYGRVVVKGLVGTLMRSYESLFWNSVFATSSYADLRLGGISDPKFEARPDRTPSAYLNVWMLDFNR